MGFHRVGSCFLLTLFLAGASDAWAESSALRCSRQENVLSSQIPLPANAPALVVIPALSNVVRNPVDFMFQMTNASGDPAAVLSNQEEDVILLRPEAALSPGKYTLEYQDFCASYLASNQTKQAKVIVGPPVALPTEIGTLGAVRVWSTAGSRSCFPMPVQVEIPLIFSPEMNAYREVSRYRMALGEQRQQANYGDYRVYPSRLAFTFDGFTCTRGQKGFTVPLQVSAHVAGATSDPATISATLEIPCPYADVSLTGEILDCPTTPPVEIGVAVDASTSHPNDPPNTQTPGGGSNPSLPDGGTTPSLSHGGGCSISRESDHPSRVGLLLLCGLAFSRWRRRDTIGRIR
jgi:hypothetical protein